MAFSRTLSAVCAVALSVAIFALPGKSFGESDVAPAATNAAPVADVAPPSGAKDALKALHPYAYVGLTYDTNLILSSNDPVATAALQDFFGFSGTSDWYTTLGAGFDSEINKGKQKFSVGGNIFRNTYDRFNELDYTGGDARAIWDWAAGRLWSGTLGYRFNRELRSFANQDVPDRDVMNRNRVFGDVKRWVTDRWRVGASADWSDVAFSANESLNRNIYGVGAVVDYVTAADNSVGLEARAVDVRFTNVALRDYTKFNIGPVADWRVTGSTRLRAAAGYVQQTYDDTPDRDYNGPVGRLTAIWDATGKTRITSEVWRDVSSLGDEIATYAVITGISVAPRWQMSPKTQLRAFAGYEQRDFSGSRDIITPDPLLGDRVDDVFTFNVGADWTIRNNIIFSLQYDAGNRDSTRQLVDYDFQSIQALVRVGL